MTLSSAATWLIYYFILVPFGLEYLETIAFILIIAALVQFIEMFLRKFVPALYGALGIYLPLITTNCAVLGAALINIQEGYDFLESLAYGFSSAVGFTLAIVIFAECAFEYPLPTRRGLPRNPDCDDCRRTYRDGLLGLFGNVVLSGIIQAES